MTYPTPGHRHNWLGPARKSSSSQGASVRMTKASLQQVLQRRYPLTPGVIGIPESGIGMPPESVIDLNRNQPVTAFR